MGVAMFMVDKILGYVTWSDRKKIDRLLEIDANLYTNLGTDSSITDRKDVYKTSRAIYRAIKTLDKKFGDELLRYCKKI